MYFLIPETGLMMSTYIGSFNWVIKFPPLVFKISFVGLELFVGSGEQDK